MNPALYLLDPPPSAEWFPFAGVRPISEMQAGVWKVRERWEQAVGLETAAVLGDAIAGFTELDAPPCRPLGPVAGPAVVADARFAPAGEPPALARGARRLEHEGRTVAWLVATGERWVAPHANGPAAGVTGLWMAGAWDLVTALEQHLTGDVAALVPEDEGGAVPAASLVLGDPSLVVCRDAQVEPGVVFDTRHGAVVIDGAEVRHGTRLEGPLYAGQGARLLGGFLRASVFGPCSVVRGEVSNTVFTGYANKAHDGFVGHSVLGHWVNLGAGTTTSNLKNTYGSVSLGAGERRMSTGRQFLGSLIGDHAKTAIGSMLSTGTLIGAGASVFGAGLIPRRVPPMSWGATGTERMRQDGFLTIASRVMPRREVEFTDERREWLRTMYERVMSEKE